MQVKDFVASRAKHATTIQLNIFVASLHELAASAAPECSGFILQLQHIAGVVGIQGRGSACRDTVREIVIHFGNHFLPALTKQQQELIRASRGTALALDNSYKAASSLAGLVHSKLQQHHASLLTVTCEDGFLLAALLVPNDGQEWHCEALRALYGAAPSAGAWNVQLHAIASLGGPLRKFPRDICTDYVARDVNLWDRVHLDVVHSCLELDIPIYIPAGATGAAFFCHLAFYL